MGEYLITNNTTPDFSISMIHTSEHEKEKHI
jgi:hypothetical protein